MYKDILSAQKTTPAENVARVLLGSFLVFAGTGHLTFARKDFQAQVPDWVPMNKDTVVVLSGYGEITLGLALILMKQKKLTGWGVSAFFAAVFPGNVSQYTHHRSAFGLDNDRKRLIRLFFQPVLIAWALYAAGVFDRKTTRR